MSGLFTTKKKIATTLLGRKVQFGEVPNEMVSEKVGIIRQVFLTGRAFPDDKYGPTYTVEIPETGELFETHIPGEYGLCRLVPLEGEEEG